MSLLEDIREGLEEQGIHVEIEDMSITIKTECMYTKEELLEKIARDNQELSRRVQRGDWIMVEILANRMAKSSDLMLQIIDKEEKSNGRV